MGTDLGDWSRRRFLGATASGVALAAMAGCGLDRASSPDRDAASAQGEKWGGELLDPPFDKPDVTFTDMHGDPYPLREKTAGKLAMLFFGYTNCPDVCPIFLNTIARAIEAIGTGPGSDALVLFVGVDVARDTPEQLRTYLGRINPAFVGLTGSEHTIAEANKALYLPPITIEAPDADGNYAVGHSSRSFAFTPDDVAHRMYNSDKVRQAQWVKDLPRLAEGQYR